jgi:hypothetical protein
MTFDLLAMAVLSISACIVVTTMANLLGSNRRQRIVVGVLLGVWFVGVCAVGASRSIVGGGSFRTGGLGALVVLPLIVLPLVTFLSKWRRERIHHVAMVPLIAVQALRVLGVFFVLLFAAHRLPAPFAPLAGYGDILTGLLAIPLAWAVATRGTAPRVALLLWSALGMGDLIDAIVLGTLSAPSPFQVFHQSPSSAIMPTLPWLLIPGFLVPCFFFLHIVVLFKMRSKASDDLSEFEPKLA